MRQDFDMIQNFEVQGGPDYGQRNLPKLRKALEKAGLDGFLVPHEDEYQNEYLPDCNERLMWVSGFTGSAGAAVVMTDTAAMFVDGRYTLQVGAQVDNDLFSYERLEGGGVAAWLKAHTTKGQTIGYDPRLHSPAALDTFRKAVERSGAKLKPMDANPIDAAWDDRPAAPTAKLTIQPLNFAGENHADKRTRIGKAIAEKNAEAALITSPASIADAQSGERDEIDAAGQLEHFRHETGQLKDLSFESISGAGSNGAIVHYRVSKATTKKLAKGSLSD